MKEKFDLREKAFNKALEGHSLILTGQCGTGKTYLLRRIVNELRQKKATAVTATTGMASLQLGPGAATLHHWSGIYDGRYSHAALEELFQNDDKFAAAKKRIENTECLIIDEISMLSAAVFDMVEFVCRISKKNNSIFGGIQVIGCGDFKQLPPVPKRRYQDDGQYCFQSPKFLATFPHHINLQEVIRQSETTLITAVNELCNGNPSEETVQFLRSLDRPLDAPDQQLTGRVFACFSFIYNKLIKSPTPVMQLDITIQGEAIVDENVDKE